MTFLIHKEILHINIVSTTSQNMELSGFSKCKVCGKCEHMYRKEWELHQERDHGNDHWDGNHGTSDWA